MFEMVFVFGGMILIGVVLLLVFYILLAIAEALWFLVAVFLAALGALGNVLWSLTTALPRAVWWLVRKAWRALDAWTMVPVPRSRRRRKII